LKLFYTKGHAPEDAARWVEMMAYNTRRPFERREPGLGGIGKLRPLAIISWMPYFKLHEEFSQVSGGQHSKESTQSAPNRLHRWVSFSRGEKFLGFEENDNEAMALDWSCAGVGLATKQPPRSAANISNERGDI
jgi:hypothetical protein